MDRVTDMYQKQTHHQAQGGPTLGVPRANGHVNRRALLSRVDRLFVELDHQRVGDGPDSWLTEVAGIHTVRHEAWVQVAPAGEPSCSVILHLPPRVTANHALAALASRYRTAHADGPQVIHVLQLV